MFLLKVIVDLIENGVPSLLLAELLAFGVAYLIVKLVYLIANIFHKHITIFDSLSKEVFVYISLILIFWLDLFAMFIRKLGFSDQFILNWIPIVAWINIPSMIIANILFIFIWRKRNRTIGIFKNIYDIFVCPAFYFVVAIFILYHATWYLDKGIGNLLRYCWFFISSFAERFSD